MEVVFQFNYSVTEFNLFLSSKYSSYKTMDLMVSLTYVFTMIMALIHYRYPLLSTFDHLVMFIILPFTSISFHTFLFIYPKSHMAKVSECSYLIGLIIICLTFYLSTNGFILIHG